MTGVIVLAAVVAFAIGFGLYWRFRSGRMRGSETDGHRLTAGELRAELGPRATLVQFSTSFCASCRPTRGILTNLAGSLDGVRYVEIDAESRPDLVRRLGVRRAPTVLVLDGEGQVVRRASGQPREAEVRAAVRDATSRDVTGM